MFHFFKRGKNCVFACKIRFWFSNALQINSVDIFNIYDFVVWFILSDAVKTYELKRFEILKRHELSAERSKSLEFVYLEINSNVYLFVRKTLAVLPKMCIVNNNNKYLYCNVSFPITFQNFTYPSLSVKDIVMISTWLDAFTFMVVCIFSTGGKVKRAEALTAERQRQEPGATESCFPVCQY